MTFNAKASPGMDTTGLFDAVTGTLIGVTSDGQLLISGTQVDHITSRTITAVTPSIAVGAGAGTTPGTTTVTGTDTHGTILVTTGTTTTTAAVIATVTYGTTYASAPTVLITPANAATARLAIANTPYVVSSAGSFVIESNTTAIGDSTAFSWFYHVIG